MRLDPRVNTWRIRKGQLASDDSLGPNGGFLIPGPLQRTLTVIASDGDVPGELGGWEHVSVSTPRHTPHWVEMDFIKRLFWADEETVMQLHPPRADWVNNHNHCLHLWRPFRAEIPLPPSLLVGYKDVGVIHP